MPIAAVELRFEDDAVSVLARAEAALAGSSCSSRDWWILEQPLLNPAAESLGLRRRPVATILELAEYADVPRRTSCKRRSRRAPVSEDVERRVHEAIEALGGPPYPAGRGPPGAAGGRLSAMSSSSGSAPPRPGSRATLPEGSARSSTRPSASRSGPSRSTSRSWAPSSSACSPVSEDVSAGVEDERRDRLDDVALLTELVTNGWRSVDRRLARLEQVVARIEAGRNSRREARMYRLDDAGRLSRRVGCLRGERRAT